MAALASVIHAKILRRVVGTKDIRPLHSIRAQSAITLEKPSVVVYQVRSNAAYIM